MKYSHLLIGLPGLIMALPLCAGDSGLDTVTVYGTRLEQPAREAGTSVSVITADDIEALGVNFAVDALARVPGLAVNQNGAFGGIASVRIRGASSEQTLVMIDGVVTNDPASPGGGFNFATLDTANIERIEVLKGPQSTLWGSDAIGGVVNIVTRSPEPGFGGRVFAEYGSFNTRRGGGDISFADERYELRLAMVQHGTDGVSKADASNGNDEEDPYAATHLSLGAGIALAGDAKLGLNVLWTDAESDFDSFVPGAEGNVGDGDELAKSKELATDLSLEFALFDGRFENTLLVGYADIERNNFTEGEFAYGSEGDRRQYRYQGTLHIDEANTLAFGAEREAIESPDGEAVIDGLFGLYEWQPFDTLTLSAGVRRDDHETFGGETTRRLAAAWNPTDALTLRASWGEGFKAPTLFQTTYFCCGASVPNPALRPETAEGWDLGAEFRTADGRGEIGITLFEQDTTNLIGFEFSIGAYQNIARATSSGAEVNARYAFTDWFSAELDYAFIDAEDGSGKRLVRVPEHSGSLMLRLDPAGPVSGSVLVRFNGEEADAGTTLDAWTRVDVAARYRLNDSLDLYARIENLMDEEYQQVLGYGTPGRSGSVGARLSF